VHRQLLTLRVQGGALWYALRERLARGQSARNYFRHRRLWYGGIVDELDWWVEWIGTKKGVRWTKKIQDPTQPIRDPLIRDRLQDIEGERVSILEFGPGLASTIGYTFPGKTIEITPVDVLAREYALLLKENGIRPPVRSVLGYGERLARQFRPESFDLVYASNSVDHVYNPLATLKNMLRVTKRGGYVLLRHYIDEGDSELGFHQWSFNIRDGDLVIWDKSSVLNVTRALAGKAEVGCRFEKNPDDYGDEFSAGWKDWVVATLKKP
jgi:SAM-dependent methyltransferase